MSAKNGTRQSQRQRQGEQPSESGSPGGDGDGDGDGGTTELSALACNPCRKRKLRCSRELPACQHCRKTGMQGPLSLVLILRHRRLTRPGGHC